eukprot:3367896-Prymnesium_polylepis.1
MGQGSSARHLLIPPGASLRHGSCSHGGSSCSHPLVHASSSHSVGDESIGGDSSILEGIEEADGSFNRRSGHSNGG